MENTKSLIERLTKIQKSVWDITEEIEHSKGMLPNDGTSYEALNKAHVAGDNITGLIMMLEDSNCTS